MPSPNRMTIAGAIEACRRRLREVSDTPWLEARILASHVTGLDASAVVAYGDSALSTDRCRRLFWLAARRAAGEPVAYLVGYKEFCGLRIAVDRRVLVPRPETEDLVMAVVRDWRGRDAEILELGTGSGAIACAVAAQLQRARVLATDVSRGALAVAERNVEQHAFGERIQTTHGDLFDAVPNGRTFDVVVANLPYVGEESAGHLAAGVREQEPPAALFGGRDGLDVYRRMLTAVGSYLRQAGAIYMECSPFNAAALGAEARARFADAEIETRADAAGLPRIVVVKPRA